MMKNMKCKMYSCNNTALEDSIYCKKCHEKVYGLKEENKMNKILLIGLIMLIALPFVLGEEQGLGNFKKGECIELIQNCANCTYINFTSVYDPNMDLIVLGAEAQKNGNDYNYSFCQTDKIGRYLVNGIGDVDGKDKAFSYDFYITTEGQSESNYIIVLIVLIFFYFILLLGVWKEEILFVTLSAMGIIILGVYININGLADVRSWITNAFGMINWGIGAYVLVMAYGNEAVNLLNKGGI